MNWLNKFKLTLPNFLVVSFVVVLCRLLAVLFFEYFNVVNDSGIAVKFSGTPAYLDFTLYMQHAKNAFSQINQPLVFAQMATSDLSTAWQWLRLQEIKPGPVFPYLLNFSSYEFDRSFLSNTYLVLGAFLGIAWAWFASLRGRGLFFQLFLSSFPSLVYYSIIVSSDLVYALLTAVFFAACWAVLAKIKGAWWWCTFFLMLLVLTRPNGVSMFPVLMLLFFKEEEFSKYKKMFILTFLSVVAFYGLIYYLPYLWVHENNALSTNYWGIYPDQYKSGLFKWLPNWINYGVSIVLFGVSKLIYAVGLRPSYADIDPWLVVLRALPGVILLPGLLYGFLRGHWFDKVFVFFFLVPLFAGASQERYLLAVIPLLMIWGMSAYAELLNKCKMQLKLRYSE